MQNYKLGEYIRQRRLDLGLTQEQVCAGICESVTLSRFENGKQMYFIIEKKKRWFFERN